MEGCPDGCPCDNWDCDATTTTTSTTTTTTSTTTTTTSTTTTTTTTLPADPAILMIYTNPSPYPKASKIDSDGNRISIEMTFEQNTEAFHSCSLTYRNEMLFFGGSQQPNQISVGR